MVNLWHNLFWDVIVLLLIENVIPILVHLVRNYMLILCHHWIDESRARLVEHDVGWNRQVVTLNLIWLQLGALNLGIIFFMSNPILIVILLLVLHKVRLETFMIYCVLLRTVILPSVRWRLLVNKIHVAVLLSVDL